MAIANILKYEGDNSTFIWKHPCEDFNSLTQLIVHESQEAVFMMNGQALDLFGAGRYTLEIQNIPLIGKALNRLTGDKSPFHCEVYFINKTEKMSIKWGTDSKVQFMEPTYGFPISIGANGQMTLRASDSRKLHHYEHKSTPSSSCVLIFYKIFFCMIGISMFRVKLSKLK